MTVRFGKRTCRWAVLLECGHNQLVSDAEFFASATRCKMCRRLGLNDSMQLQCITARWTIWEVCRHKKSQRSPA